MFRYRTLNESTWSELKHREIYFASRKELNDPLDLQPNVIINWKNSNDLELLFRLLVEFENEALDSLNDKGKDNSSNRVEDISEYRDCFIDYLISIKAKESLTPLQARIHLLNCFNRHESLKPRFVSEFFEELENKIEDSWNKVRVACFFPSQEDFKMWSMYGDRHRGVCSKYNSKLVFTRGHEETMVFPPTKVHYSSDHFTPNLQTCLDFIEVLKADKLHRHKSLASFYQRVWAQKREIWKNEEEIRVLKLQREFSSVKDAHVLTVQQGILEEVYLGALIDSENEKRVTFILKNYLNAPKMYKMDIDSDGVMSYYEIDY